MDEESIEEIVTSQLNDLESLPKPDVIEVNDIDDDDNDDEDDDEHLDSDLISMLGQQPIVSVMNPSVIEPSSIEPIPVDDNEDDFVEDETLLERIIALKEMFPESIRNTVETLNRGMINTSKLAYNKGRSAAWWVTSSMCVLVFPILIQKELLQIAEQISREQRNILLGPQAATGAISGGAF